MLVIVWGVCIMWVREEECDSAPSASHVCCYVSTVASWISDHSVAGGRWHFSLTCIYILLAGPANKFAVLKLMSLELVHLLRTFLLWRNNDFIEGAGITWLAPKILVGTTERMRTASSELVYLLRAFLLWRNNDVMGGAGLTWSAPKAWHTHTRRYVHTYKHINI